MIILICSSSGYGSGRGVAKLDARGKVIAILVLHILLFNFIINSNQRHL